MAARTKAKRRAPLMESDTEAALRRRGTELVGLILIALAALAAAMLWTYSPDDPSLFSATDAAPVNALGLVGASLADPLHRALGWAAYGIAAALAVWGLRFLLHAGEARAVGRSITLPVALLVAAAFAATHVPPDGWRQDYGLGGLLGDARLGALISVSPLDLTATLRLASLLLAAAFAASAGYALGVTWAEAARLPALPAAGLGAALRRRPRPRHRARGQRRRRGRPRRRQLRRRAARPPRRARPRRPARRGERPAAGRGAPPHRRRQPDGEDHRGGARPPRGRGPLAAARPPHAAAADRRRQRARGVDRDEPDPLEAALDARARAAGAAGEARPAAEERPRPLRGAARARARPERAPRSGQTPPLSLLQSPSTIVRHHLSSDALEENARMLETVLDDYGVRGEITSIRPGPVVTLYELEPAAGLKASRVIGLSDDIARSMSALACRVSTIPGRSVIGIELPNDLREKVLLREILAARAWGDSAHALPLALGKDIGGEPVVANLARMPHLLIAGTTGSGKSVAINTMILVAALQARAPTSAA